MFIISKKVFLFYMLLLLLWLFIIFFKNLSIDIVGFSFFINSIITLFIMFLTSNKGIKTINFVLFFYFLFFCFASWLQYSQEVVIWSPQRFTEDDYLLTNFIIFFSILCTYASYLCTTPYNYNKNKMPELYTKKLNLKKGSFGMAIILAILSFIVILDSKDYNFISIFYRGNVDDVYETISTTNPLMSILVILARFLPMFLFLLFANKNNKLKSVFLLLLLLLCSFPMGIPRFFVAFIYIPIIFILFKKIQNSLSVIFVLTFSMFYIFPFLNQFRYYDDKEGIKMDVDLNFLTEGHFDAYQNLMSVIKFNFITYGEQLLGSLLFFIPRSFWNDKPTGSGYALAHQQGFSFDNISMPYIAEGYANFGILGAFIFSLFLGFFMKKIDTSLLISQDNFKYAFGVFWCSALFFMQRGDLMTSISIISACIVAYVIAMLFVEKKDF